MISSAIHVRPSRHLSRRKGLLLSLLALSLSFSEKLWTTGCLKNSKLNYKCLVLVKANLLISPNSKAITANYSRVKLKLEKKKKQKQKLKLTWMLLINSLWWEFRNSLPNTLLTILQELGLKLHVNGSIWILKILIFKVHFPKYKRVVAKHKFKEQILKTSWCSLQWVLLINKQNVPWESVITILKEPPSLCFHTWMNQIAKMKLNLCKSINPTLSMPLKTNKKTTACTTSNRLSLISELVFTQVTMYVTSDKKETNGFISTMPK